jgi:16S rRNA (cytosine967-C5)-methyltransferase
MLAPTSPQHAVRRLALDLLCRLETASVFADLEMSRVVQRASLSSPARAFLRELVYGVLRWRTRLDWFLGQCSARPLDTLTAPTRNLLRLGAYQLCMMDHIPSYAAVNETVRVAKQVGHAGVVAFVNAVLRALERQRRSLRLPERETDLMGYLTITEAHPRWLIDRWLPREGVERTVMMCRANNQVPALVVRANRLRITREALIASLASQGCHAEPCHVAPDGIMILSHPPLEQLQSYTQGWFTVQDEAAMLCGYLLDPQPGERVLDACAAPGGKASHMAELMGDTGEVVCVDRSQPRLRLAAQNYRRLSLQSTRLVAADAISMGFRAAFDRILVDAPCSGLGVLRRHPEAKWRKGPELIPQMVALQQAILHQVSRYLRPGGCLVYTTCSTEPEENRQVVESFLESHRDYRLEPVTPHLPPAARPFADAGVWFQTWPGPQGMDGFFGARLRRLI